MQPPRLLPGDHGVSRDARWDACLAAVTFMVVLGASAALVFIEQFPAQVQIALAVGIGLLTLFALANRRARRSCMRALRAMGDRFGVAEPELLIKPWVRDGDTLEDRADGRVYRLANIDAPETGEFARCFHERRAGERAKWAAVNAIRSASRVSVRRTRRRDRFGRVVAYVFVDGVDLGELLMAQGLARAWRGWRPAWCGPKGPLARFAAARGELFSCGACCNWR
ncbi:MAG: thermonuclease family protein [Hyphomonadaceae bacterium]|nr:thermonuclease family protein [Hyphomonadaceae bacterium]